MELYFDEPREDIKAKLHILCFWREEQVRYLKIARMAGDTLPIYMSTVASKSVFNVGGRVLGQYQRGLKLDNVEALICSEDWLSGKKI